MVFRQLCNVMYVILVTLVTFRLMEENNHVYYIIHDDVDTHRWVWIIYV